MDGNILKQLRIEHNLTQKEFADIIGVAQSTLGMYEQNRRKPEYDKLNKIADYFGVSTDLLLGRCTDDYNLEKDLKNIPLVPGYTRRTIHIEGTDVELISDDEDLTDDDYKNISDLVKWYINSQHAKKTDK